MLHLVEGSDLIDANVDVGLAYADEALAKRCFESEAGSQLSKLR